MIIFLCCVFFSCDTTCSSSLLTFNSVMWFKLQHVCKIFYSTVCICIVLLLFSELHKMKLCILRGKKICECVICLYKVISAPWTEPVSSSNFTGFNLINSNQISKRQISWYLQEVRLWDYASLRHWKLFNLLE